MSRFSALSSLPDDLGCAAFGAAMNDDITCREFERATAPTKEEIARTVRAVDQFVFQSQDHTSVGVDKYACFENGDMPKVESPPTRRGCTVDWMSGDNFGFVDSGTLLANSINPNSSGLDALRIGTSGCSTLASNVSERLRVDRTGHVTGYVNVSPGGAVHDGVLVGTPVTGTSSIQPTKTDAYLEALMKQMTDLALGLERSKASQSPVSLPTTDFFFSGARHNTGTVLKVLKGRDAFSPESVFGFSLDNAFLNNKMT